MGWLFTEGQTRERLIAKRIDPSDYSEKHWETLAHCYRGGVFRGVLWIVWGTTEDGDTPDRWIECDLLQYQKGYGWGYKSMEESMHPYYYSCPLKYLEMVPMACEEWRQGVWKYHAKQQRKLIVGNTYYLEGCIVPFIRIISVRPLRGIYSGNNYTVSRQQLGKEVGFNLFG